MKEASLVLALFLIIFPLLIGTAIAEFEINKTQIENRTESEIPLGNLNLIYRLKKNESLSEEAVKNLDQDLKARGADKFFERADELNLTIKAIKGNKTHFIVSTRIKNNSLEDLYFGKYPKAGKNMQNLYLKINLDFIESLASEWEGGIKEGREKPSIGVLISTGCRIFIGMVEGKIVIKPFWAVLKLGKFLRMGTALKSSKTTAIILQG